MKQNTQSTTDKKDFFLSLIKMDFADIEKPVIKESRKGNYVVYGKQNDYAEYLLDMLDGCGKHNAIIGGKVDFITGTGFAYVEDTNGANSKARDFIAEANQSGESLDDINNKLCLDFETFGGAYLQILYDKAGKVSEIYHIDFSKIRPSLDLQNYYFAEDWLTYTADGFRFMNEKVNPEPIPAFNPVKRKGKQILFVRDYRPGTKVYPKPSYFAALRYINIDISIGEYHLNGISNGMFSSKLINFNNGVPGEPEQKVIEKKLNNKFSGAKNAGKVMLSFNKSGENAPTILDLSGTDLDKHFDLLERTVERQIFSSHRVTSPALFGIKTEGIFANNEELRDAADLFQNTYCDSRRGLLEKAFNAILSINEVPPLYIQRGEPIGVQFSEATIAKVLTEDEIRETLGRKPKTQEQQAATPAPENPVPGAKFSTNEDEKDAAIFGEFGEKKSNYEIIESRKSTFEDDFQFLKSHFASVTELTGRQKEILNLIKKDPKVSNDTIADALNISKDTVNNLVKGLINDGLLIDKSSADTINRAPSSDADSVINRGGGETTSIKIMYSYEGIQDSKNRPFCAKMLELDRVYSRFDIERISARLGYSVWDRRGGWYRPKGSNEARPYCRHYWQTNTVINKSQN